MAKLIATQIKGHCKAEISEKTMQHDLDTGYVVHFYCNSSFPNDSCYLTQDLEDAETIAKVIVQHLYNSNPVKMCHYEDESVPFDFQLYGKTGYKSDCRTTN